MLRVEQKRENCERKYYQRKNTDGKSMIMIIKYKKPGQDNEAM